MHNEFLAEPPPLPRLFSIRAVSIGIFVGGPLAAGYFIGQNYRQLGNVRAANVAFTVGIASTGVMLGILFNLPSEVAERIGRLFPAVYTPLAAYLAHWLQGEAIQQALEKGARKATGWVIAGWSIAALVVTLGAIIPFALAMPPLGFHGEKHTFGPKGAYEIYAAGEVSPEKIKALADYLIRCEYFNGEDLHLAQVVKDNNAYTLELPFDREHWDKPDFLKFIKTIKMEIEQTVLMGKLTLLIVDEDYSKKYRKEI